MASVASRISLVANGALDKGDRVKLDAAADTVSKAAATEASIGLVDRDFATGDLADVILHTSGGAIELRAAGAFAVGATLYGAADGEVDDVVNAGTDRFRALVAATAADQLVQALPVYYGGA